MSHPPPRDSFSSAPPDNDDSDDDQLDTKPSKGKDGEKGDRKGIINRVNRELLVSRTRGQLELIRNRSMCEHWPAARDRYDQY